MTQWASSLSGRPWAAAARAARCCWVWIHVACSLRQICNSSKAYLKVHASRASHRPHGPTSPCCPVHLRYGVLTSDRYTCYTEAQASEQLKSLLASKYIPAAATLPNWSSMNINQRCAMLSMTYNCYSVTNPASFPKCHGLLKAKDWVNAPKECMDCVKGINGVVLLGLQSRRLRETKIWAMPTAGSVPCCASAKQDVQTCISNIKNQCICPSSDSTTTCKNRALAWCPPYTNGCVYGQTF